MKSRRYVINLVQVQRCVDEISSFFLCEEQHCMTKPLRIRSRVKLTHEQKEDAIKWSFIYCKLYPNYYWALISDKLVLKYKLSEPIHPHIIRNQVRSELVSCILDEFLICDMYSITDLCS